MTRSQLSEGEIMLFVEQTFISWSIQVELGRVVCPYNYGVYFKLRFYCLRFSLKKTFLSFHISQVSTVKHDFLLCHYHMDFAWAVLCEHFSQKCENDLSMFINISAFCPVLKPAFMLSRILFLFCSKLGILERHEVYFLCFFFFLETYWTISVFFFFS